MSSPVGATARPRRGPRRAAPALAAALVLAGCAGAPVPPPERTVEAPLLAVFPVENLSGARAPLGDIRQLLIGLLRARGVAVVDDATLERIVTKHRVRYTAGVERGFAQALRQETGAQAIVIPSLERYEEGLPPRVGLFARLVSTGDAPVIRWIDGTGIAGDDAPGLLGIGLVYDPAALLARATEVLVASLVEHLADAGARPGDRGRPRKFRPKVVYRSDALDPDRTYSVAVVPFFNKSPRKYAGEILALHMIRNLMAFPGLQVVEPGLVREELLRFRIIMSEGVSLPETETILNAVDADLVLNGEVLAYQDAVGATGTPKVDFGLLFIERRTRRVVYSSYSDNAGDDGVFFFDVGRVNTAHALAAHMAGAVVRRMLLPSPTARASEGSAAPVGRGAAPAGGRGREEPR